MIYFNQINSEYSHKKNWDSVKRKKRSIVILWDYFSLISSEKQTKNEDLPCKRSTSSSSNSSVHFRGELLPAKGWKRIKKKPHWFNKVQPMHLFFFRAKDKQKNKN